MRCFSGALGVADLAGRPAYLRKTEIILSIHPCLIALLTYHTLTPYACHMQTYEAHAEGTTLLVNPKKIDITAEGEHVAFTPEEDDKVAIALAVLGDPPPLTETSADPATVAEDSSLSDGELRFQAINSLLALEIRRKRLREQTAEAKAKAAQEALEAQERKREIDKLESAYIQTLTKRRWSTAASRLVAETLYNQGARIPDPEPDSPEAA